MSFVLAEKLRVIPHVAGVTVGAFDREVTVTVQFFASKATAKLVEQTAHRVWHEHRFDERKLPALFVKHRLRRRKIAPRTWWNYAL